MTQCKPNYNEAKYNREFYTNKSNQTESYLPEQVNFSNGQQQYDPIYNSNDDVNSKDFLIGALVGGIIGAATALFLAPKSGAELRGDVTTQATHLKEKTVDFSSTAKEKTSQLSSQLKEKSGPLVDKVKSIKSKTSTPMDDGTASSEGEEPIDFMETVTNTIDEVVNEDKSTTSTAKALKEAVADKKTV
ncbi:YtxH domain-containing protein [Paenisporosarcina sp. OV554]|uniref:YtxH domain-containing protein n=1 Tax=Paenisporosarcina sp. OV554 TaxID=2135694 RepID=UPI000D35204E|nr:YtxH domain-containing protein [Paenisporosarcina sp. OV554]PUB15252.1 gas vesicle protein [Paenisporosarcina sp. OV554]